MASFKNWFRPASQPRDGLTQPQREAIVDLLNYCVFADRNVASDESATIDQLGSQLDWDPNLDFEYYVNKSIGAVRRSAESKDHSFFVEQIRTRLDSPKSRQLAVALCEKLMKADGRVTTEESDVLKVVRQVLVTK